MSFITPDYLYKKFLEHFPHIPTQGQSIVLEKLSNFVLYTGPKPLFVIKGYAGTGKTSVVRTLVDSLEQMRMRTVLLAPTGRAAKVLSNYTGKKAHTIHRFLYYIVHTPDGAIKIKLQQNLYKNTVFVIDEASMISASSGTSLNDVFHAHSILDDVFEFVYSGINCRLILIGDSAQLPPIGSQHSPALNLEFLKASYDVRAGTYELDEVVRQEQDSGILVNATKVRNSIDKVKDKIIPVLKSNGTDVVKIDVQEFEDAINEAYGKFGVEDSIFICRTNKRANLFNQQIRNRILGREGEINAGDLLMVVKNNYFWLPENSQAGFIANGEIIELLRVKKTTDIYGFRFAEVTVRLIDYPEESDLDTVIMLDTLDYDGPSLDEKKSNELFQSVCEDFAESVSRKEQMQKVKESPYFNALQVKFAYAVTCHKAQGGQWKAVFTEQGYLNDKMDLYEYYRWLYTALTRTTEKLWLVNFDEKFFT